MDFRRDEQQRLEGASRLGKAACLLRAPYPRQEMAKAQLGVEEKAEINGVSMLHMGHREDLLTI